MRGFTWYHIFLHGLCARANALQDLARYKSVVEDALWPYGKLRERFAQGARYDVMGTWPSPISDIDPNTNISKGVTDEEI